MAFATCCLLPLSLLCVCRACLPTGAKVMATAAQPAGGQGAAGGSASAATRQQRQQLLREDP